MLGKKLYLVSHIFILQNSVMKSLIFLVVALFAVNVKSFDKDEMVKVMSDCKASVGASDADVANLMSHGPTKNHEQKCMFSCFMDAMDIVSKRYATHNDNRIFSCYRSKEVN